MLVVTTTCHFTCSPVGQIEWFSICPRPFVSRRHATNSAQPVATVAEVPAIAQECVGESVTHRYQTTTKRNALLFGIVPVGRRFVISQNSFSGKIMSTFMCNESWLFVNKCPRKFMLAQSYISPDHPCSESTENTFLTVESED